MVNAESRNDKRSYLIIGQGRLSKHLQFYFQSLRTPFLTWDRRQSQNDLELKVQGSTHILLVISDDSLKSFFETHLVNKNKTVIHFSGSFSDARMMSCHPLMTFSESLFPPEFYSKLYFAVTGVSSVQDLFPEWLNPSFEISLGDKSLYHAWCVLSAAGTQQIWLAAEQTLSSLGVPKSAFHLYLGQILENFQKDGRSGLTGPWVRNDQNTIKNNLHALDHTKSQKVYEILMGGLT